MILTCPSCATRYMAEAASFEPSGRMVRCAQCSHSWYQESPDDCSLKALPHYSGGAAATITELTVGDIDRTRRFGLISQITGWLALLLVASVFLAAAYQYRVDIVRLWPQAATLYSVFGENINTRGLIFQQTHYERIYQNDMPVLTLRGEIVNKTSDELPVPRVKVTIRDADERSLFDWTFDPMPRQLRPGEVGSFETQLSNPPSGAQDLMIRFSQVPDGG